MEQHYKLFRVRELADNDEDFIATLAEAFIEEMAPDLERLKKAVAEEDYHNAYQAAHKMLLELTSDPTGTGDPAVSPPSETESENPQTVPAPINGNR